jgi:hypothetical protein
MLGVMPWSFLMREQRSIVRSDVLPPAPQVTSTYNGFWVAKVANFAFKLETPSAVRGGKNSNAINVRPSFSHFFISSQILGQSIQMKKKENRSVIKGK